MKSICWKNYVVALLILGLVSCGGGGAGSSGPAPPIGPASAPQVTSLKPAANTPAAPVDANITAVFDQIMNTGDDSNFVVDGSLSGELVGTYSGGGTTTLSFDPDNDFKSGEEVEVILTTALTTISGASLDAAFVYRFRVAVTDTGSRANFVSADTVRVRDEPSSVTAGDWDGDGDLDLAVVNSFTDNVTVLLNDGSGSFSEALGSPVRVGSRPASVTAGDWDGDGDLDLAVVNWLSDNVTVLLNDGSARFSEGAESPVRVSTRPVSVTAGDWDGDGDLDLAVVNSFTDNVTILLNGGNGSFDEAVGSPVRVRSSPVSVKAGDWDGDGDLDLAVVNSFTDNMTVLLNYGNGSFDEAVGSPVRVGSRPASVIAGDWDGDGDLDLVVVNEFTFDVTVLLNGGSGSFSEALGSPVRVGDRPVSVTAGDWDGDGDLDLAVVNWLSKNVTVLRNGP